MSDAWLTWLTARLDALQDLAARARKAYTVDDAYAGQAGTVLWPPPVMRRYEDRQIGVGAYLIRAFCPDAVLALVDGHRRILAEHRPAPILNHVGEPGEGVTRLVACRICGHDPNATHRYPCQTVTAVLVAHRHAPGFQDGWLA